MTSLFVVLLGLVLPGFVPALCLTRYPLPALALAPIVTGLACAFGGILALVTKSALLPWVVVTVVALNVGVVLYQRTRMRAGEAAGMAATSGFPFRSMTPLVLVVGPLLTVRQAPYAWDARSIWWFHADWFWAGGASLARALANPAFVFSHPDYPPVVPATIGSLWRLRSAGDLEFAQLVSAILTVAPIVLLAMAIGSRFTIIAGRRVGALVSALAVLAVYGGTRSLGTDGYVDLQWAAAFCAAAVILLLWPPDPRHAAIGAVALAYAALTKNEGTLSAVILLAIIAFRFRRQWRLLTFPSAAVAAGIGWMAVARLYGAESDLTSGPTASSWLRGDFTGFDRVRPTLTAVWGVGGGTMVTAMVTLALGAVLLRHDRHRLTLPGAGYIWLAAAGIQLLMLLVYVSSPIDLQWYLATSLVRTMLVVRLLLLVEVVVWIGVAIATASGPPHTRATVEDGSPA